MALSVVTDEYYWVDLHVSYRMCCPPASLLTAFVSQQHNSSIIECLVAFLMYSSLVYFLAYNTKYADPLIILVDIVSQALLPSYLWLFVC